MAAVKTAVSIDQELFRRWDALARTRRIPRSKLLSQAREECLAQHDAVELTRRINRACAAAETSEEKRVRNAASTSLRRLLEGAW